MPKISTSPILLDEVKQISITKLKQLGYFEPESFKTGRLIWSIRGQEIGSINLFVDLRKSPQAYLNYTVNQEEKISYEIDLVSVESNLGIGRIWYFLCPHTGKRCRKLYGAGKYFLHRGAFPEAMYECQTYSKRERMIDKVCKVMNGSDKLYEVLYSKHFKTHYAGKKTKRYKKILSQLERLRQDEAFALNVFKQEF